MISFRKFNTPFPNPQDHGSWRACAGVTTAESHEVSFSQIEIDKSIYKNRLIYCTKTDIVWTVCLHKANIIDKITTKKLLLALKELSLPEKKEEAGGENSLIPLLDGDEDIGSLINLGRTMQEPMTRLQMRDQLADFFDYYLVFLSRIYNFIEENKDTIMQGHTHFSQANPITLASYFLSVFDSLHRGLEQLELSYSFINRNTGGCGATSGTAWPVDRWLMTDLLGMDDLNEPTYDGEGSQDHTLSLLFALSNITNTLSKVTVDFEIWGLEELDWIRIDPSWAGVSSMMPQKCHNGDPTESIRVKCVDVMSLMQNGLMLTKAEPHGDVLATYRFPTRGIDAMAIAKGVVRHFTYYLDNVTPQKEKMLEAVKNGYSCMTEVVVFMVKELGYGGRRSHRICAALTRLAREKNVKAPDLTKEMLDEAALMVNEVPPHIETSILNKLLDPLEFINSHSNIGGPAPCETERMLKSRKKWIEKAEKRQNERLNRIENGEKMLKKEIDIILN